MSTKRPYSCARDALFALALAAAWLAATAWARPLMLPDEGRYVSVAWEMLRSGDWLTPTLNGLPFFHKPPLFYWITGAALWACGLTEIAARAAPITGAVLGAFSLYLFTRRWSGQAAARRALWVLLVQPLFFVGGQFANLDMLVAGCITATVLALAHAALCREQGLPYRRALWMAYVLAALGVLAKGLIGFVIPAMVIALWLALRRQWRTMLALLSLPGVALFVLVAAPWFVAMQQRFEGFWHYFFIVQHFQRFAAGGFNNVQPFWFYPVVLAVLSLPGLLWGRAWFSRGYFAGSPGTQAGALRLLMACTVACVLLFFSLPQSKLLGYILPAVPPLAWLIADASAAADAAPRARRLWRATLATSALLGVVAVLGLAATERHTTRGIGLALRDRRGADEPVFMLQGYLYDVPFYAGLRAPAFVVEDWDDPELPHRDNWRKELADAGAFAPERAAQLLLLPVALPQALCRWPTAWVAAASDLRRRYTFLDQADAVRSAQGMTLWRIAPGQITALNCPERPNGDSAHR